MKPNILFFCSWLDINSPPSFFYEQAELFNDEYNTTLVVFKIKKAKLRGLFSKNLGIFSKWNRSHLTHMVEIMIPEYSILPKDLNKKIANQAVKFLKNELIKSNFEPVIIHAQSVFDAGIWAYKYHFHYKTPFLITEHSQISFLGVDAEKLYFFNQAMQKAKYRLVVSNDKIRQFAANNIFHDFVNIGNLINPMFTYKPKMVSSENLKFVTIGAYSKLKDQETILKALNIIDSQISKPVSWTWIGSNAWGTDHSERVNILINKYPLKNIAIEIKPILNRKEILVELQTSNLFILSSINEGMPVSVLEALACGVPVYSTFCGGVDEIINDTNGKLFPIKDSNILAKYLLDFISETHIYDSEKISKEILKKYGETFFKEKMNSIYKSILNDTRN